jgi:hypothetical protein
MMLYVDGREADGLQDSTLKFYFEHIFFDDRTCIGTNNTDNSVFIAFFSIR